MNRLLLMTGFLISTIYLGAQASWNTRFAFILRDENGQAVDLPAFHDTYQLINVFGDTVPNELLRHSLTYDESNQYFILDIETIGPRFSFALVHDNERMVVYLPFNHNDTYYAVDFSFRKGRYLFDFNIKRREAIYLTSNFPYFKVDKIKWNRQRKRLMRSDYALDHTYEVIHD